MKLCNLGEWLHRRRKPVRAAFLGLLALAVFADWLFVDKGEAHTALERIPGFWSGFGFVACLAIVFFAKGFGRLGIVTREDDDDGEP